MKLTKGVYFYPYEDLVYLRNVNDAREYLFNPIVYDILSFVKAHPGCSREELCQALLREYEIDDENAFREDIGSFAEELMACGLLEELAEPKERAADISEQIQQRCQEKGQLYSASLELTYRCSERCIHCYVDDHCDGAGELTLEEYKDILNQLRSLGCIHILLTGGEVCLHKDFIDIARYAVSLGFLVDVYTNGISMTDEQFDALCEMKVNSVSVSLYSGEAKIHDAITKVPGSFEKTLKRTMMFKCAGVDTFIKTVVIQQNLDSLGSLYRLGKRLGIDINPATSISDTHTGGSNCACRLETQEQRLRAAKLLQEREPEPLRQGLRDLDGGVCKAAVTNISIDPYGGVHPCLAFPEPVGSVREKSIREIWENAPLMRRLRSLRFWELSEDCGGCQYADYCGVCVGSAYSESGGRLCPNQDACQWAKAKYDAVVSTKLYNGHL